MDTTKAAKTEGLEVEDQLREPRYLGEMRLLSGNLKQTTIVQKP